MDIQNYFLIIFRYLNVINYVIINELYSIINKNYWYIEETQIFSHDGNNDLKVMNLIELIKYYWR